ncbi:MAG: NF041680 family putative transposase [Cyanobacteria bacterium P01_E01_bin.6]
MNVQDRINQLNQFREQVYASFNQRSDSLMDLLDALCGNTHARSVVELSLNPMFRREYGSLYGAIGALRATRDEVSASDQPDGSPPQSRFPQTWIQSIAKGVPPPSHRDYWLFGVDVTPVNRPHAITLKDRESVYKPTVVAGQKPITLGHNYSLMAAIPEAEVTGGRRWIVPLSVERVTSFESKVEVGQQQVERLLDDETLPWHSQRCVLVVDSDYSHRRFLYPFSTQENRVIVTRSRANRVFYRIPQASTEKRRGHPRWYGQRFDLKDETTWGEPDEQIKFETTTTKGHVRTVTLTRWYALLMKGSQAQPMHAHPFDLVQVQLADPTGHRLFKPQWLIVFGHSRQQLDTRNVYQGYTERFNLEHGIRFTKQNLMMNDLQTPDVTQEEAWVQFSWLAYVQLWMARLLAQGLPQPWQRFLPDYTQHHCTPAMVQRDFTRIIRQIGTPAAESKPRGKSPGRTAGTTLSHRPRRPIIKRGRARLKKKKKAA